VDDTTHTIKLIALRPLAARSESLPRDPLKKIAISKHTILQDILPVQDT
jgi:hypothetical protein